MKLNKIRSLVYTLIILLVAFTPHYFTQDYDQVQIQTTHVSNEVYMMTGVGGNIGLSVGEDSILLIESQFPELYEKIVSAIAEIDRSKIRFLFNTNWHYDHCSGNSLFAEAGAIIMAHTKTRENLKLEQYNPFFDFTVSACPEIALPVVTFNDSMTVHFNNDEIKVLHYESAHSDADIVFLFKSANVIHVGDIYYVGSYPYIDITNGGTISGVILAVDSPCADMQGGLGMFQFDAGTYAQTVATYGDSILTIEGNTAQAVNFVVVRAIQDITGVNDWLSAVGRMNAVPMDAGQAKMDEWMNFIVCRYNGCCSTSSTCTTRAHGYRDNAIMAFQEMGADFWRTSDRCARLPDGGGSISAASAISPVAIRATGGARPAAMTTIANGPARAVRPYDLSGGAGRRAARRRVEEHEHANVRRRFGPVDPQEAEVQQGYRPRHAVGEYAISATGPATRPVLDSG